MRRTRPRHPVVEPAFPLLPRAGRSAGRRLHGRGAATGYAGPLSLEIFNDQFRAGSAVRTAIDGLRSLILLRGPARGAAVRSFGAPLAPKAQERRRRLHRVRRQRDQGRDLAALFGQLGFRKTGAHRSKDVERWSQGEIDLVINCEPDGFRIRTLSRTVPASAPLRSMSTTPASRWQRAEALKARTFYQPVGPGELEIPAIRGVGGSLLYFLERPVRTGTPISKLLRAMRRRCACTRSTTSRSRCPTTRCCRGCCSTPASSTWSACRRWKSPFRAAWCRARP